MLDASKVDLCKYRLEKAYECLRSAELLKDTEDYASAANRSYTSLNPIDCIEKL